MPTRGTVTGHLAVAAQFDSERFPEYTKALGMAVDAYSVLSKSRLQTELSPLYENLDFRIGSSAMALFNLFNNSNLQGVISETFKLLYILITTPIQDGRV